MSGLSAADRRWIRASALALAAMVGLVLWLGLSRGDWSTAWGLLPMLVLATGVGGASPPGDVADARARTPPAALSAAREFARARRPMQAIRTLRAAAPMSLLVAKTLAEQLRAEG